MTDGVQREATGTPIVAPRQRSVQSSQFNGVLVRVLQRILALTTAIWHNDHTGQPIKRSLLAYDH